MIKPELVKVGDVLWDCHRYKMGNTTMSAMGSWEVEILDIGDQSKPIHMRTFIVRWNGNEPRRQSYAYIAKLRRSPHRSSR